MQEPEPGPAKMTGVPGAPKRLLLPLLAATLLAGNLVAATSASAQSASVVVVGSVRTVRPNEDPDGQSSAALFAARNEFESFQVVIRADSAPVQGVSVQLAEPLEGAGGTISRRFVTIYREGYYRVKRRSDVEGARGRWPDALIPSVDPYYGERRNAFPVDVPAGENRVAWVDVLVPAGQRPGTYQGSLLVSGSGLSTIVPVRLTVLGWTMSSTNSLVSAFGMSSRRMCNAHFDDRCRGQAELGWRLKSLYTRVALENRISISSPAHASPEGDGSAESKAGMFRRYVLPYLKGRTPAGPWTKVRLRGARLTSIRVHPRALPSWRREAEQGGFTDRAYLHACDEPGSNPSRWSECRRSIVRANAQWPELATLVTARIEDADDHVATPMIDVLAPGVRAVHSRGSGNHRPEYDAFAARPGREVWMYTACGSHGCRDPGAKDTWVGWPSYVIDQPASQARAMGWLAFEYRLTGELYYSMDQALPDAWSDQYRHGGNGDGTLFYPGRPDVIGGTRHIPIESIRLKRIRDGHEDHDYLRFLAVRGRSKEATAVARDLFPAMYRTTVSQTELTRARAELARMIASIVGGPRP
jgi:hypothetical protein